MAVLQGFALRAGEVGGDGVKLLLQFFGLAACCFGGLHALGLQTGFGHGLLRLHVLQCALQFRTAGIGSGAGGEATGEIAGGKGQKGHENKNWGHGIQYIIVRRCDSGN